MSDNAALARRWFEEVWNQRRAETIDELLTPRSVCHDDSGDMIGVSDFKTRLWTPFLEAFPDIGVTVDDVISDGDQVVTRWTATGKYSVKGLGLEPTGHQAIFRGMTWMRIENGKMIEGWQSTNIPEVIRELDKLSKSV